MSARLAEKVCIITGAGSGIGKASALRFGTEGGSIVVADVDGASAESTVAEIRAAGGTAMACLTDVADPEAA